MKYFAYGSNLLKERLTARTPSVEYVTTGFLSGYNFRFHKIGPDGSGKADAWQTDRDSDRVWGVIYDLDTSEKEILDRIEEVGHGYLDKEVLVNTGQELVLCFAYFAQPGHIDSTIKPFDWYQFLVLAGLLQHNLPRSYLEDVQRLPVMHDVNQERYRDNADCIPKPLLGRLDLDPHNGF